MDEHVILISGATSGIGLATLKALAEAGHRVVGFGRSPDKVAALLPELKARYGADRIDLQSLDVRNLDRVRALVDDTAARYDRLDGLVNAAGLMRIEKSHKVSAESFDLQLDTLLKGSFFAIQAALPHLLKQKAGLVVNLGSVSGLRAAPQMAVYGAAKAALQHLTASLAAEYAPKGIRFLCVNPGPVRTELMDPLMFAMLEKKVPLQRLGEPEEVAALIRFLFSDEARFMTGSSLTIDGGAAL
jgi:3-oxoacyl-[acyl-carrier protein] reductase